MIMNANGDPGSFTKMVRQKLKASYPEAAVSRVHTFAEEMSNEVSERVFLMQVAMAFGAIALFLSILGSYGLLAYEVSLREKEIGIRLALGSSREGIIALLLKEEGRWLALGGLLGMAGAMLTGYLLRAEFYGARSTSPFVLAGAALLLLGPALMAILVPAGRAAFLEPASTLRRE